MLSKRFAQQNSPCDFPGALSKEEAYGLNHATLFAMTTNRLPHSNREKRNYSRPFRVDRSFYKIYLT